MSDNGACLYLHRPDQATTLYVQWAEQLAQEPGITFGCALDQRIIPLHAGDLMIAMGRPGHCKSSFLFYMAKRVARQIRERGDHDKECVVYVSWEEPVEAIEAHLQAGEHYSTTDLVRGNVDLDLVRRQAIPRVKLPVWTVAYSVAAGRQKKAPMTIEVVYEAIRSIRDSHGLQPALVCLDYLQKTPVPKAKDRTPAVEQAVVEAKYLALDLACPVIAGAQAGRHVDNYAVPVPRLGDGQHSSALEQNADIVLALWKPSKTHDLGKEVDVGGVVYTVTDSLLVMALRKQKLDIGSGLFAVNFTPQTLEMSDFTFAKEYLEEAA